MDLDPECSLAKQDGLSGFDQQHSDYVEAIGRSFKELCGTGDKVACILPVGTTQFQWPPACQAKIEKQMQSGGSDSEGNAGESTAFFLFAEYNCRITPSLQAFGGELEREQVGVIIAVVDLVIMTTFLLALHLMSS